MWEFPGGKQEANESPEDALIRELKEELSIDVEVLQSFSPYDYRDESIEVSFYPIQCKIIGGMIVNNEHEEVKFISLEEIDNFNSPHQIMKRLIWLKRILKKSAATLRELT